LKKHILYRKYSLRRIPMKKYSW